MSDDLAERLHDGVRFNTANHEYDTDAADADMEEAADRIEALTAQLESTLKDRAQIIAERDRTFALMLARVLKAEADNARLRDALADIAEDTGYNSGDQHHDAQLIARAALTGKEPSHD
jgi:hypothetical protein